MQRIDTATKAVDLFGVGKHGFTPGDPLAAILATRFNAAWCNAVQEEIARVIEASGAALNGEVYDQLLTAIQTLIGTSFDGAVAKSLINARGDLLVGTADNTVDRLAAGNYGQLLMSDLTQAAGVKWAALPIQGQCVLERSGPTQLKLSRKNGRFLFIRGGTDANGSTINGLVEIPAAGVTINVDAGWSASTTYYIYAFVLNGVMTLEPRIASHSGGAANSDPMDDDQYGHRRMSGDASRTLVGMVRTTAATQLVDSNAQRFVLSWFNRRRKALIGTTTAVSSTSISNVELAAASRVEYVIWADGLLRASVVGSAQNNTAGHYTQVSAGLDGAYAGMHTIGTSSGANAYAPHHAMCTGVQSEGYHYLTPLGLVSGGTGTFGVQVNGYIEG